jgi:hypothetical protein
LRHNSLASTQLYFAAYVQTYVGKKLLLAKKKLKNENERVRVRDLTAQLLFGETFQQACYLPMFIQHRNGSLFKWNRGAF